MSNEALPKLGQGQPSRGPLAVVDTASAIGDAVRRCRRVRRWSIELLAERADVSYQYLCEIENGKRNFSIVVLERIARALEMSLLRLIGEALAPRQPAGSPMGGPRGDRLPPLPEAA